LKEEIESVPAIEPPKNLKELHGFIGAINYYRDMWPHRSDIMVPLRREHGAHKKGKIRKRPKEERFKWTDEMQDAFEKVKALTAIDTISAYLIIIIIKCIIYTLMHLIISYRRYAYTRRLPCSLLL